MSSKEGKKRKKNYYCDMSKKRHKGCLDKVGAGMKGFLATFERSEFHATKDCYELLNEYADKLWGPEKKDEGIVKDVEDELADELKELKESSNLPRRFKKMSTEVAGNFFVSTTVDEPGRLTTSIFSDLKECQSQRSRFLLRLLPVQLTCKANTEAIQKAVKTVLSTYEDDDRTFLVAKKVRHNNDLSRASLLTDVVEAVRATKPKWIGELRQPELVIMLDVQKTICFVSILPNYLEFKKYNLLEVTKPTQPADVTSSAGANIAAENASEGRVADDANSKRDEANGCQGDGAAREANGGKLADDDVDSKSDEASGCKGDCASGKAGESERIEDDATDPKPDEANQCRGNDETTSSTAVSGEEG
ncbi:THUMP domain-containing protein 1 [Ixodes scapularis]